MRFASRSAAPEVETAVVCQAAALVLSYPDEALLAGLPAVRAALAGTSAEPLFGAVLAHLGSADGAGASGRLLELQAFHVTEFDLSRRHALHLTYWTEGDTRRRGETLTDIKRLYRESGLVVRPDGELPDYLPMVLEFTVHDRRRGLELMTRYRPSLELLRLGLEDDGLPHAGVLQAVCDLLPGPAPTSRAEIQALARAAQPTETVGLEPFTISVGQLLDASPGVRRPVLEPRS